MCGALRSEGARGICGAGKDVLVARAALHFWEEPPISGERGSGTVFFTHCPLGCVYCQNASIAQGQAGVAVSVERLAHVMCDLQEQGALNINCVTPTHYSTAIAQAVGIARGNGLQLPVLWNTSGYERAEVIHMLRDTVDVYLTDYKYADAALAQRYSRAKDYPEVALRAIEAMLECVGRPVFNEVDGMPRMTRGVVVRHLILPNAFDNSMDALKLLFKRFGNDVLYSIMNQYTPIMPASQLTRFPELGSRVSDEDYERLLDFADDLGIDDYFWQEGLAAEESFIPAWDFA